MRRTDPLWFFFRDELGESYAHDAHPFVACLHLLKEADESSLVTISVPYLTDTFFLDELCHFAKPIREGGRNLEIRIILGPSQMNTKVIREYFIGSSLLRYQAVNRLHIRTHGTDGPRGSFMHSKTMLSTAGGIIGSYDYTFAARFRNREDGVLLTSGPATEFLRQQFLSVWDVATQVNFPEIETSPKSAVLERNGRHHWATTPRESAEEVNPLGLGDGDKEGYVSTRLSHLTPLRWVGHKLSSTSCSFGTGFHRDWVKFR